MSTSFGQRFFGEILRGAELTRASGGDSWDRQSIRKLGRTVNPEIARLSDLFGEIVVGTLKKKTESEIRTDCPVRNFSAMIKLQGLRLDRSICQSYINWLMINYNCPFDIYFIHARYSFVLVQEHSV